jgi:hypothetical protein
MDDLRAIVRLGHFKKYNVAKEYHNVGLIAKQKQPRDKRDLLEFNCKILQ